MQTSPVVFSGQDTRPFLCSISLYVTVFFLLLLLTVYYSILYTTSITSTNFVFHSSTVRTCSTCSNQEILPSSNDVHRFTTLRIAMGNPMESLKPIGESWCLAIAGFRKSRCSPKTMDGLGVHPSFLEDRIVFLSLLKPFRTSGDGSHLIGD